MDDEGRDMPEETFDEPETFEEPPAPSAADEPYVEPAPELGNLHRDYVIPGVDPSESNPYRWHTGEKRDHGGEDAIEVIDLVKQFGRMRILNGLNLGLPDDQVSMVIGPSSGPSSVAAPSRCRRNWNASPRLGS